MLLFMSEQVHVKRRIQPRETPTHQSRRGSQHCGNPETEGSHVEGMHCCSKLAGRNSKSTKNLIKPRNKHFDSCKTSHPRRSQLTSLSSVEWTGSERLGSSLLTTSKSFFTSSSMVFPATSRRGRAIASSGMEICDLVMSGKLRSVGGRRRIPKCITIRMLYDVL